MYTIKVRVSKRELVQAGACRAGIDFFESLKCTSVEWTDLHSIWLAKQAPSFACWAREKGIIPQISMSGADLSGANLSGANLSGANLSGADLSEANLSGANLSWADLYGANLSWANLSGADLSGATLSGANLYRADLSGANLYRAVLYRVYRPEGHAGYKVVNGYLRKEV